MDLLQCTYKNTPPFHPVVSEAVVVRVVDGDTVHLAFKQGAEFARICVRLFGLDTAELHSKNAVERRAAEEGKKHLEKLVNNAILNVSLEARSDKYGRWLATLTCADRINVNEEMLKTWAVPYDGKKKSTVNWAKVLQRNGIDDMTLLTLFDGQWGDMEAALEGGEFMM